MAACNPLRWMAGGGVGIAVARSLDANRAGDVGDLLDVCPFVASEPPRIEQYGAVENRACPRHRRPARPVFAWQGFQDGQEVGALRGEGAQGGMEV